MPEPTGEEIQAEIKALEECKTFIPPRTMFGDDNIRKVDLQIEYLRGEIDTTADEFNEDYTSDEQRVILEAQDWEEGNADESPSSGWQTFRPKVKAAPKSKKK